MVKKAPIKKKTNLHMDHVPSDEMDLLISMVNSEELGWKADECKLQKHHEMYSKCQIEDVELLQIDEQAEFGDMQDPKFSEALQHAQSWAKKYAKSEDIPDEMLPETFDLRNINGFDFTGSIRDQGRCGSCYTVAFTQAIESRLLLKYGKKVPSISPQMVM